MIVVSGCVLGLGALPRLAAENGPIRVHNQDHIVALITPAMVTARTIDMSVENQKRREKCRETAELVL